MLPPNLLPNFGQIFSSLMSKGRGYGPRYSVSKGYKIINRLNRSQKWPRAKSYKHARSISPYPNRPVV